MQNSTLPYVQDHSGRIRRGAALPSFYELLDWCGNGKHRGVDEGRLHVRLLLLKRKWVAFFGILRAVGVFLRLIGVLLPR